MSYKPFKPNKDRYYAQPYQDNHSENEIKRMKLFGFRSGIAWKMIPALFYYCFMVLITVSSIMGEIREFKFEPLDILLCFLKYLLIVVIVFSPAIFLSDFRYREKLPFFKKKTLAGNSIGMLIVIICSVCMVWVSQACMSDTYKTSTDIYYQKIEDRYHQQLNEMNENR